MLSKLLFSLTKVKKHVIFYHNQEIKRLFCCYSSATQVYHSGIIKLGSFQLLHVSNYLLTLYIKDSHIDYARKLFGEIPHKDVRTWTILISGLSRYGHHRIALNYFVELQDEGTVAPNAFTLSTVLKCCTFIENGLKMGKAIHGWITRNNIDADVALDNALLDLYTKFRAFDYVKRVFEFMDDKDSTSWNIVMAANLSKGNMKENLHFFQMLPCKSVSSWNTIIDGLLQNGFEIKAMELLYEMASAGPSFNTVTFSISLALTSSLKNLDLGRQIHGQIFRSGMNNDTFVGNSLIDMYCKCRAIEKASLIFQELCFNSSYTDPMAQNISWSTMIAGYAQNGMVKEALTCFTSMILEKVEMDLFTLTTIIAASASMTLLELGQMIHAYMIKLGHVGDTFLCSSIIDMYAKCGKLEEALLYFKQMRSRNVVIWSVMISSYSMHGLGREAIRLFELMHNEGVRPNEVTFVGLLTACSRGGLLEEGCKYFRMMIELYGIRPKVEHFSCMVDLFGRAGHLNEIENFVYENGIHHVKEVWKAYLSSCRIHKNVEMTNWVSKKLFELQQQNDDEAADSYLLRSNAYSDNNDWVEAAQCRDLMKERKIKKDPGQSWVSSFG